VCICLCVYVYVCGGGVVSVLRYYDFQCQQVHFYYYSSDDIEKSGSMFCPFIGYVCHSI
jgi:hypothetical protein